MIKSGDMLKRLQIFVLTRDEKHIPPFQRFILKICAFHIAVAPNGQDIGLEAASKIKAVKRLADKFGISRQQDFADFDVGRVRRLNIDATFFNHQLLPVFEFF